MADVEAVVIALKTRTIAAADAVSQSLAAYRWLAARPTGALMVKYCSTFNSTADGNIGPVVDAVLDASGEKLSIVCPAFPTTKRTVYKGHLFVGDVPLDEFEHAGSPAHPHARFEPRAPDGFADPPCRHSRPVGNGRCRVRRPSRRRSMRQ